MENKHSKRNIGDIRQALTSDMDDEAPFHADNTSAALRATLTERADVPTRLIELRGKYMLALLSIAEKCGINYDAPGNGNASKNDLAKQIYEHEQLLEKAAAPVKISTDAFKPGIYRFHFKDGTKPALGAVYTDPYINQKFAQLVLEHCGTHLEDLLKDVISYDFVCDQ